MPITPGWTTTEFWAVVAAQVFAVLEIFHIVVPNQGPLVTAISVLAAAIATAFYAHSRGRVKAAQQMAAPAVHHMAAGNSTSLASTMAPITKLEEVKKEG